jgi:hypothetical protein
MMSGAVAAVFGPMAGEGHSSIAVARLDPGPTLRSLVATPARVDAPVTAARLVEPGADLTARGPAPEVEKAKQDPVSGAMNGILLAISVPRDWEVDILITTASSHVFGQHFAMPTDGQQGLTVFISMNFEAKVLFVGIVLPGWGGDGAAGGERTPDVLIRILPEGRSELSE